MKREQLEQFLQSEMAPKLKEKLNALEKQIEAERERLEEKIIIDFAKICGDFSQDVSREVFETAYISFHPLRTRIINRDFRYQVRFYNSGWCENDGIAAGSIDFEVFYRQYAALWDELVHELQKYGGNLKEYHVEIIMQQLVKIFHRRVVKCLRKCGSKMIETEAYQSLGRAERLYLYTGEILEKGDLLLIDNQKQTDMFEVRKKIEEKAPLDFEDLREKQFEQEDFSGMTFDYTDFGNSQLNSVDFSGSILKGTKFTGTNISNSKFLHAVLEEVDFKGSNLKNLNFAGAIIRNTDFTNTEIKNCMFEKAIMLNCSFWQ